MAGQHGQCLRKRPGPASRGPLTEMCVDVAHLVFVAFGHTNDHVVDEGSDGSESSDVFPRAMVQLDMDNIFLRLRKGNGEMAQVLGEFACDTAYQSAFIVHHPRFLPGFY
jgi:hypothetical protein